MLTDAKAAHKWSGSIHRACTVVNGWPPCLQAYFDANATTIQKWWRGFFSRKHIHNFYARKAYLAAIQQQNSAVRASMQQVGTWRQA